VIITGKMCKYMNRVLRRIFGTKRDETVLR
jgi:hypothetical protein